MSINFKVTLHLTFLKRSSVNIAFMKHRLKMKISVVIHKGDSIHLHGFTIV